MEMDEDPDVVRFMMQDSSPFCKRDWLMTRTLECKTKYIVDVAQSALALIDAIKQHVYDIGCDKQGASSDAEDPPSKRRKMERHNVVGFYPEPGWLPHLANLKKLTMHCYTPAALASGYRGVVHSMASTAWQMHIDSPTSLPLDRIAEQIVANTSDMGGEVDGPSFHVHQVCCESYKPFP